MKSFLQTCAKGISLGVVKYALQFAVVAALALNAATACSQTPLPINQVGLPSNGVFSGGSLDSVQLNNGNLHVDIPLLHLPGIGMDTDIHFVYDNKVWTDQNNEPSGAAVWMYIYQTRGLWSYEDPLSGGITETSTSIDWTCDNPGGADTSFWIPNITLIAYTDTDGTSHPFPALTGTPTSTSVPCENINPWLPTGEYAQDSSGFVATTNSAGDVATIMDKHGRNYIFNQNTLITDAPFGPSYFPVTVEDENGNKITNSASSMDEPPYTYTYTLTDTVNRAITEVTSPTIGNDNPAPGATTTIKYKDQNGNTQTIIVNYVSVSIDYPAICAADGQPVSSCSQNNGAGSTATVSTVQLPGSFVLQNGDTYTIAYNSSGYGEISSITLPTGGVISYTYGHWDGTGRPVISRTVTANGVSSTWDFNYDGIPPGQTEYTSPPSLLTTVTDPNSNDTVYTCTQYVLAPPDNFTWMGVGPAPCYMTQEQIYSGSASSGVLLATKTTGYTITGVVMPTSEIFTWNTTGQTSETDTVWDSGAYIGADANSFGNVLSKMVYDFGTTAGVHGALLSNTQYSYLQNTSANGSAYYSANILDRVSQVSVYNSAMVSSSTLAAQTTTAYDAFTSGGQSALKSTSGTTQHDYTKYSSANTLRGLPTSVTKYTGASSASITTYANYNDLGKPTVTTDGLGYSTKYTYGAQNAFLATTTMPATANGVAHVLTDDYDVNTGLLLWQKDYNGSVTGKQTTYTYDSCMRPLVVTRPDGGTTTDSYPTPTQVVTTVVETPSPSVVTTTNLDGLGRTINSA
jgi:hypothetical protein